MKYITILIILGLTGECLVQQTSSIEGEWISKNDNRSILNISRNAFCQIYNGDTLHCQKYVRSSASCDTSYLDSKNDKNLDFIRLEDGTCFEITGLTDSTLAYRHTQSGRMQVFSRSRSDKKALSQ